MSQKKMTLDVSSQLWQMWTDLQKFFTTIFLKKCAIYNNRLPLCYTTLWKRFKYLDSIHKRLLLFQFSVIIYQLYAKKYLFLLKFLFYSVSWLKDAWKITCMPQRPRRRKFTASNACSLDTGMTVGDFVVKLDWSPFCGSSNKCEQKY